VLDEIERKILDTLKENEFDVDSVDFQQIESGQMLILNRPAA